MAISIASEELVTHSNGTSCTVNLPSGWAANDYAVIFHRTTAAGSVPVTTPSGWTLRSTKVAQSNSTTLRVFYKLLAPGDTDPIIAFEDSSSSSHSTYTAIIRGADTANPIDLIQSSNQASNVTSHSFTFSRASVVANEVVIVGFGLTGTTTTSAWTGNLTAYSGNISYMNIARATVSSTATYSAGYTAATARAYAAIGISFREAPAGAPSADAGLDQNVLINTTVTLHGSGSTPTGTITGYTWRQISGTTVSLSSTSVATPTFTAPGAGANLEFGLTVTNSSAVTSAEDVVTITVESGAYWEYWNGSAWQTNSTKLWDGGNWL